VYSPFVPRTVLSCPFYGVPLFNRLAGIHVHTMAFGETRESSRGASLPGRCPGRERTAEQKRQPIDMVLITGRWFSRSILAQKRLGII
jgi:hypothetical protein